MPEDLAASMRLKHSSNETEKRANVRTVSTETELDQLKNTNQVRHFLIA